MRTGQSRVTLADVARDAGVALSTASLVFSGRGPVATDTADRVVEAAARLGYAGPNPVAARLRTGRTGVIGVSYDGSLASAFADPYQVALLEGFAEVIGAEGYRLLLLPAAAPGQSVSTPASAHGMDALLYAMCGGLADPEVDAMAGRGVRLLGTGTPDDPRVVQLRIPDRDATATVVAHLRGLGHTRIGHVTMPIAHDRPGGRVDADEAASSAFLDTRDRALGFLDGGGDPALIAEATGLALEAGVVAAGVLLDLPERPTALVCQSDLLAAGAVRAAQERGLVVPGDLSVIGFDGVALPWFDGRLTTIDQAPFDKGRHLGAMMLRLLAGETVASEQFPVTLVVGSTTGPAPSDHARIG